MIFEKNHKGTLRIISGGNLTGIPEATTRTISGGTPDGIFPEELLKEFPDDFLKDFSEVFREEISAQFLHEFQEQFPQEILEELLKDFPTKLLEEFLEKTLAIATGTSKMIPRETLRSTHREIVGKNSQKNSRRNS